jgi:hypothetical protein
MSGVQRTGSAAATAAASAGATGATSATLVPDPEALSGQGIDDALGLLFAAMAKQRQCGVQDSSAQVKIDEKSEEQALADEQAAQAAEEANQANHGSGFFSSIGHLLGDVAKDVTHVDPKDLVNDSIQDVKDAANSPAFWNDLEKGALVVAKVAAVAGSTVATGVSLGAAGATLAGAALLLSVGCEVGGEVVSDTKCFGNDSAGIGLGLEVTGLVAGLVGGVGAPPLTGASKTALGVGLAFTAAGGAGEAVAGGAHLKTSDFAARVQDATADQQKAVNQNTELAQTTQFAIDDLRAADKSRQATQQSIQGAIQAHDKTTVAAATGLSVRG